MVGSRMSRSGSITSSTGSLPHQQHQHAITLRFKSSLTEQIFALNHKDELVRNVVSCGWLLVVAMLSTITITQLMPPGLPDEKRRNNYTMCLLLVIVVVCLLVIALLKISPLTAQISPFTLELVATTFVAVNAALACAADPFYMAKLAGISNPVNLTASSRPMTDSIVLLVLCTSVTLTHMHLPIRWLVLLPFDTCIVLYYFILEYGIGGPEQENVPFLLVVLSMLVFTSLLGKYNFEKQERKHFYRSIADQPREQVQFRIDQPQESHLSEWSIDTEGVFATHSTSTQHMFNELGKAATYGSDFSAQLKRVLALGKREHWLVSGKSLQVMPSVVLGSGAFGVVVGGCLYGLPVAVKIPRNSDADSTTLPELANELAILRHVRHPHIVAFHGACVHERMCQFSLILEWVDGETLKKFVSRRQEDNFPKLTDEIRAHVIHGICSALRYLHAYDPCIIHGDLKSGNIMVQHPNSSKPHAKLLDFGLSRKLTTHARPLLGTMNWMAPEVVIGLHRKLNCPPHPAADVYSFGCLVHFVITSITPLNGLSHREIIKHAEDGISSNLMWPTSPIFVDLFPQLIKKCLNRDPEDRPQMKSIHEEVLQWYKDNFVPAEDKRRAPCVAWDTGALEVLHATPAHPNAVQQLDGLRLSSPQSTPRNSQASTPKSQGSFDLGAGQQRELNATSLCTITL